MRKALVVGIDYYESTSQLTGAVKDAYSVKVMLDRHADASVNFGARLMVGTGPTELVRKNDLKDAIGELFSGDGEIALFYFAGHGYMDETGGYLCASDTGPKDDGLSLDNVMTLATNSRMQNKVIMLDSCQSGTAGNRATKGKTAEISDGVTILTASTDEQYASEEHGSGVFTSLLVDALGGGAANLVGEITPGAIYSHIDQSLGPWAQRPVFKTNVKKFVSLRKVQPFLELRELQRLSEFFPNPGFQFPLDPSYEPERAAAVEPPNVLPPDPEKNAIFKLLQKYNREGLLKPEGADHMWHAAMQSKSVRLTALGEHYRRLAAKGLI